ncbi:AAA domain-containing protein [Roseinatronobacter sp. S2]|uniref:AAA domain-containing protein n=1 Tax=Roseinatronobacter sp. S2 TaxID=3035471 RepID=UPI00240EC77A|nr:AAA domain-containing protein [Roseinatronobacter sp. S2]WFE75662.1 AAA domain-containing protein [Roseinatronobacter sp. S2]
MQVTNCGRGVHAREVKGLELLKKELPSNWYAFTNLDLALGLGKSREIDLIIVSDHRIFFVDIKDWNGNLENREGRWFNNGRDYGPSPVQKIGDIGREVLTPLRNQLKSRPETRQEPVPFIASLVVLTGSATNANLDGLEKRKVLSAADFIKLAGNTRELNETFGEPLAKFLHRPLTDGFWKDKLSRFFNVGPNSPFKPGRRRFQRYLAEDISSYAHPSDVYREYEATEEGNKNSLGILRLWDFTKCKDGRFQTEEGRLEIAGREQQVYHWLRDRDQELERTLLTPRLDDPDRSVNYWEIYDRRRRMRRLNEFAISEASTILPNQKIELARQVISAVAALHRQNASHLDLGGHSIWLELPTSVRLSHLLASRFPEGKSLGTSRYQFLSGVTVPEDVLEVDGGPKRRDVFLLGVAVHTLLFGQSPTGEPAEWDAEIDAANDYSVLHDWFAEALEIIPEQRFADATIALESYNRATASRPTSDEIISKLESFRETIRSQRQLFTIFPVDGEMIVESDRVDVWRSIDGGVPVLVKQWKQPAWGDLKKEGGSILSFLRRAANMKADKPLGVAPVRGAHWLGDSIVLVQAWIEGVPLDVIIRDNNEYKVATDALELCSNLVTIVDSLHEQGIGHGDLKPANIVVDSEGQTLLIDVLDYSPRADGEIVSSEYAPDSGNRMERDRFALTKITEEILTASDLAPPDATIIASAIRECREKPPVLTTLLPLQEALMSTIARLQSTEPKKTEEKKSISVSLVGQQTGPVASDEGFFFVRVRRHPHYHHLSLHIRGAFEELEVRLDEDGRAIGAKRRKLEQWLLTLAAKQEFYRLSATLTVTRSDVTDLSELEPILNDPVVKEKIAKEVSGDALPAISETPESADAVPLEDEAEDALAEEIAESDALSTDIDVPELWRVLMEVENELTTEAVVQLDSDYDRGIKRHKVVIELESGEFGFSRNDTVAVQKQDKKGNWRRIGDLDINHSKPDLAVIDAQGGWSLSSRLVEAGQRLRFLSHFEGTSLKRRSDAVDRILAGNGRANDLMSVFDSRSNASPEITDHHASEESLELYGLNDDQTQAFRNIINSRPVGLLQGPPGTGKTKFIAALAHYTITNGLVRNVLLSSQSHEAVNNAAEAVLTLFRKTGELPSLLRVGMDGAQVSPPLRPYHTSRVEQSYKDQFSATFGERMAVVGKVLGLPHEIISQVVFLETTVRPVVNRICELARDSETQIKRINSLVDTLQEHLSVLDVEIPLPDSSFEEDWNCVLDEIAAAIARRAARQYGVGADRIERLRSIAGLGRDFIGSVSRAERSFDTFLAGTRQIVAGTCVGLGRSSLGLTATAFDLVIIDEAARCTSGELLVPLQAARWAVLVGDHAQLQPQHKPEIVNLVAERTSIAKKEIKRSDFERIFMTNYGRAAGSQLKTQYRMLSPIGQLVSETFYPDLTLLAGRRDPVVDPHVFPSDLKYPLTWVETDGLGQAGYERNDAKSKSNPAEADAIIRLLDRWYADDKFRDWLLTQQSHPIGIGVICMYAAQRNLIERKLRQSSLATLLERNVKVGTVDSYQGKENPIVILSLVRNNQYGPVEAGSKTIKDGFLVTPNRINVAVSRAMDRLVIVGSRNRWRPNSPMGRLSAGFERRIDDGVASAIAVEDLLGIQEGLKCEGSSRDDSIERQEEYGKA